MRDDQALGVVEPVVDLFVGDFDSGVVVYRTELTLGYSVRRGRAVARQ